MPIGGNSVAQNSTQSTPSVRQITPSRCGPYRRAGATPGGSRTARGLGETRARRARGGVRRKRAAFRGSRSRHAERVQLIAVEIAKVSGVEVAPARSGGPSSFAPSFMALS